MGGLRVFDWLAMANVDLVNLFMFTLLALGPFVLALDAVNFVTFERVSR